MPQPQTSFEAHEPATSGAERRSALQQQKPPASAPQEGGTEESPPPEDWAPELLDALVNSPNAEARDALLDSAFAAGPAIVPLLEKALQDDRTAEFAAQSLAFIGGGNALEVLSKLSKDPRDLNLRRFYYGALAEFEQPQAAKLLLYVVGRGDEEQDRTVTEAAILALTVRSDPSLVAPLKELHARLKDIVIKDDVENALDVIQARARYLASPEGKKVGGSVEETVRTYFVPALEVPLVSNKLVASPSSAPTAATLSPGQHGREPDRSGQAARATAAGPSATPTAATGVRGQGSGVRGTAPAVKADVAGTTGAKGQGSGAKGAAPAVSVEIAGLTYSPDRSRALAHVIFDNPLGTAYYDMVLQKRYGNWALASVWLGSEVEKASSQQPVTSDPPRRDE